MHTGDLSLLQPLRGSMQARIAEALREPAIARIQRDGGLDHWWQSAPRGLQDDLQALHLHAAIAQIVLCQLDDAAAEGFTLRAAPPPDHLPAPGCLEEIHELAGRARLAELTFVLFDRPSGPGGEGRVLGAVCWPSPADRQPVIVPITRTPHGQILPLCQVVFDPELRLPATFHPGALVYAHPQVGRLRSILDGAEGRCAAVLSTGEDAALSALSALAEVPYGQA